MSFWNTIIFRIKGSFCLLILLFLIINQVHAQQKSEIVSQKIIGHIFKPAKVEATEQRLKQLSMPSGFTISKFAENLGKPRMIVTGPSGIYVSRRTPGDVLLLKDSNGDGKSDTTQIMIKKKGVHGLAIHDDKLYLATVTEVYSAPLNQDGTTGELQLLIDNLPEGGQHPNRTIGFGPDSMMYITVGSTCNACAETNKQSATILQANPDGSNLKVYAKGLRNTIGFDWHPKTAELYGMDHGIDWLGDKEQKEELNHLKKDAHYGWPYIFGDGKFNKADKPDSLTYRQFAEKAEEPVLLHTAHSAPMNLLFYQSEMFPEEYKNDAFVSFHGSWNRKPASGYKISRIHFENGKPVKFEDFITGFLTEDGKSQFGRVVGLAALPDGSLLVTDDDNGIIYRIAYQDGK